MSRAERLLRFIDKRPRAVNAAAGVGLGIGLPLAASLAHPAAGLVAGAAVLGGSVWLGLAWQPIAIEQEDSPVRLRELERALGIKMVTIPAGKFLMGSLENEQGRYEDEGPQHPVRVSRFEMMNVPVTQRLYQEVAGENPSHFQGDNQRPVEQVSWLDAVRFCNKLSERAGLTPAYLIEDPPVGAGDEVVPRVDWEPDATGYRLPTEAEWEYAARAGSRRAYCFGDDSGKLGQYAWYSANSPNSTQAVGQKAANKWGLYDVHGNVWEWCWDFYDTYKMTNDTERDPSGPETGGRRVVRGGSFYVEPRNLRTAVRFWFGPGFRDGSLGFRCVRGGVRQL